jgi:hypothetical protein
MEQFNGKNNMACAAGHPDSRRLSGTFTAVLTAVLAACQLSACVSQKYKRADKKTPPAQALNVKFPPSTLDAALYTEISDGSPGSWKREAFWDEYVVVLHNQGEQALQVSAVVLTDYAGASRAPGDDPWALERESKTLERRYREAGIAFARVAAPRAIVTAAEPGVVASAGVGSAGAAAAATATAVALPVYGLTVFGINMHHKADIRKEFERRRLRLPSTLSPGESRTGSFFFPMVPNPRALSVKWSGGSGDGDLTLPLDFLEGLHVRASQDDREAAAAPRGAD